MTTNYRKECPICLENEEDETILEKFICGHYIHKACFDERIYLCPICRTEVRPRPALSYIDMTMYAIREFREAQHIRQEHERFVHYLMILIVLVTWLFS